MKSIAACLLTAAAIGAAAAFSPVPHEATRRIALVLVDADTDQPIAGVVRIRRQGTDQPIRPPELISRGWGLAPDAPISQWSVVSGHVQIELPAAPLTLEAISGIESERALTNIDLTDDATSELRIALKRMSAIRSAGWRAANTHLHLRNLTREESERYLREIPAADRLDVLFISYLERAEDDRSYITNEYSVGRRRELESAGVLVANGEEHRHNFGPQGEGYGHVMLLGIKELVQPVSIGFGITKKHPDWPAIRAGIETARAQGGAAIWCHNNWGYEDVPNWLAGRLDAQNIFDGGSHGGYAESFYRYLNAGLKVPFSTGTDWFMYDFARCYARVAGDLTPESWLAALKAGRTFITNGPLLELRVNSSAPGDTIELDEPRELTIDATARARLDFGQLELIQNGRVIESTAARSVDHHYAARLAMKSKMTEPGWLAARVTATAKNEYGQATFAHTSPVYVTVAGRTIEREADVRFLLNEVESAQSAIAEKAQFATDQQRHSVLALYHEAAAALRIKLGTN